MNNQPKKHHYIPQFILRNFCFDGKQLVNFYNKTTSEVSTKNTREIFMKLFLYQDTINHPEDEMKLEKDFAAYETEIAAIFKQLLNQKEIRISRKDIEKIKLFVAIMRMRSDMASDFFKQDLSEDSKKFYSTYQQDGNYDDMWKRNLGHIVNCRSWREVWGHKDVDNPFKRFIKRDALDIYYPIIAETRGNTDFILSDAYPVFIYGEVIQDDQRLELPLYTFLPLSPTRILILASCGAHRAPYSVRHFDVDFLKEPHINPEDQTFTLKVKRLYENNVNYINGELIKNNKEGYIFKDKNRLGDLSEINV